MNADRGASHSILIVDDDPANLEVLSSLLEAAGYEVLIARDGESAIARAQYDPPDLICLDVMMPGIDGFETCKQLKQHPLTAEIPVIFMTALSETVDQVRGLSLGAVDYIPKPFYEEVVLSRIQLHLKLRSLAQTLSQQNEQLERLVAQRTAQLNRTIDRLQTTQTQLLLRERQLEYEAFHDTLTGLPNRLRLMNHLESLLTQLIARYCAIIKKTYQVFSCFLALSRLSSRLLLPLAFPVPAPSLLLLRFLLPWPLPFPPALLCRLAALPVSIAFFVPCFPRLGSSLFLRSVAAVGRSRLGLLPVSGRSPLGACGFPFRVVLARLVSRRRRRRPGVSVGRAPARGRRWLLPLVWASAVWFGCPRRWSARLGGVCLPSAAVGSLRRRRRSSCLCCSLAWGSSPLIIFSVEIAPLVEGVIVPFSRVTCYMLDPFNSEPEPLYLEDDLFWWMSS